MKKKAQKNNGHDIYLASSSPRRQELLKSLDLDFTIRVPNILEKPKHNEPPVTYAKRNAKEKARAVFESLSLEDRKKAVIISADTIVIKGKTILEKPLNKKDAFLMLKKLQNAQHLVITGYCIIGIPSKAGYKSQKKGEIEIINSVSSHVFLKKLSDREIRNYIATGEPMDKAGSYAIQGKGAYIVARVNGSYTNVVGLPLTEVGDILSHYFGVRIF